MLTDRVKKSQDMIANAIKKFPNVADTVKSIDYSLHILHHYNDYFLTHKGTELEVLKFLFEIGADVNIIDEHGIPPLVDLSRRHCSQDFRPTAEFYIHKKPRLRGA